MTFQLDPRLESDSSLILNLNLCQIRLSHNAAFPWIILIPNRVNISEIIDLNTQDQHLLMQEIALTSTVMQQLFHPTKLNIANLGNIVPQLHIHVVARYNHDKAWPNPIWNAGISAIYDDKTKSERIEQIKESARAIMQSA